MDYHTLDEVTSKLPTEPHTALVRIDADVDADYSTKKVADTSRLEACKATVDELRTKGYAVILAGHIKRPPPGEYSSKLSTSNLLPALQSILDLEEHPRFAFNWEDDFVECMSHRLESGEVGILDNLRFSSG